MVGIINKIYKRFFYNFFPSKNTDECRTNNPLAPGSLWFITLLEKKTFCCESKTLQKDPSLIYEPSEAFLGDEME